MPPAATWTGAYVGGGVDARFNAVDANVTEAFVGTPPVAIPLPKVSEGYNNPLFWWGAGPGAMQYIDNISIGLRLYGGYNWQVAPRWVIGVEADFAYANEIAVFHGSPYPANLIFGLPGQPATIVRSAQRTTTSSRSRWDGTPASGSAAAGSPLRRR